MAGTELLGPGLGKWTLLAPREWESRIKGDTLGTLGLVLGSKVLGEPGQALVSLRTDINGDPTARLPRATLVEGRTWAQIAGQCPPLLQGLRVVPPGPCSHTVLHFRACS